MTNKPAIVFWIRKIIALCDKKLGVWKKSLTHAEFHELKNVGHFPQEEIRTELCPIIKQHISKHLTSQNTQRTAFRHHWNLVVKTALHLYAKIKFY